MTDNQRKNRSGRHAGQPNRNTPPTGYPVDGDSTSPDGLGEVAANRDAGANGNGHGNGNGRSPDGGATLQHTQPIHVEPPTAGPDGHTNGNGNGHSNGNGTIKTVRPVKARLSTGHLIDTASVPGVKVRVNGNGNGNGHSNGNTEGLPHLTESPVAAEKARVAGENPADLVFNRPSTGRLRDTDIQGLRLRLKTQEWPAATTTRTGRGRRGKRPLPYFLMRHRSLRSHSRVGHARAQASARKHGKGGAMTIFARVFVALFVLSFLLTAAGFGAGLAGAGMYMSKLPPVDPEHLTAALAANGINVQTTTIYDRNGTPLTDLVDEETGRREELTLDEISPLVISATVAAEDATFFTNAGVDPLAIVRAVTINLKGDGSSGASTITQQVARNIFMTPDERQDRSMQRKIKEAILAVQLAQTYTKDDIMLLYLNQNPYGHRAYGIGAAARTYFNKPAKDLNLAEAALLAGLPQSPTLYDPLIPENQDRAKRRQAYVLDQMAKEGMITEEAAVSAKNENVVLSLNEYKPPLRAPHFVYYVKEYLEKLYGPTVSEMGLKVYTTLDLSVQEAAEKVARDRIEELRKQKATNASIVIMKPGTGEILAMVGSVDYNDTSIDGQVNVATRERQPGSSFKPITYVTAFKKGWTPGTVVLDTLTGFPNPGQKDYVPNNYDGRDHGWVTVRESLGNSYNIPAVKALQFAGVQDVIDTAHDMGIKGLNRGTGWYGLSLTLGGGEVTLLDMTTAYSTFANYGKAVDANPIMRIEDPQGRTIYQLDPNNVPGRQVIDPRLTYMITSMLSDNRARTAAFGPNSPLKLSFPAAAKTGTTDDNRDSWTMGYTPELTIGVWVGNSNNDEMLKVTGAIGAAVIWHNMMETFYDNSQFVDLVRGPDGKVGGDFPQPEGLIKASACSNKGTITDLFLKEAPPKGCVNYKDKNKQLRSAPNNGTPTRPNARPTPIPGIVYPTPQP